MDEVELLAGVRIESEDGGARAEGDRAAESFVDGGGRGTENLKVGTVDAELGGAEAVTYGRPSVVQYQRALIKKTVISLGALA